MGLDGDKIKWSMDVSPSPSKSKSYSEIYYWINIGDSHSTASICDTAEHGKKKVMKPPQLPLRIGKPKAGRTQAGSSELSAILCTERQN